MKWCIVRETHAYLPPPPIAQPTSMQSKLTTGDRASDQHGLAAVNAADSASTHADNPRGTPQLHARASISAWDRRLRNRSGHTALNAGGRVGGLPILYLYAKQYSNRCGPLSKYTLCVIDTKRTENVHLGKGKNIASF
jgi:hypothetical protein